LGGEVEKQGSRIPGAKPVSFHRLIREVRALYDLMNKDVVAAKIHKGQDGWYVAHPQAALPAGKFEINDWLEDRKAYKHNHHLKRLMVDCGCDTVEGFLRITHAASINDSYWVKKEGEEISWEDISFYRNEFNGVVSRLAFEGLYGMQMSSTSPELTTDGSFCKCWRREKGEIYLYKRGMSGAGNVGLEPYCEALASELIQQADPGSVAYSVVRLHKETATKCRAFTDETIGFVPLRRLISRSISLDGLLRYFEGLGCREAFQRMLVQDAVIFNVDRHLGNAPLCDKGRISGHWHKAPGLWPADGRRFLAGWAGNAYARDSA